MAAAAILKKKLERLRMEKPRIIRGADKQLEELEDQVHILIEAFPRRHRLCDLTSKAIELVLHANFIIDAFISVTEVSIRTAGVLHRMFLRCFGKLDGLIKFKEEIGFISREIQEIAFKIQITPHPFCDGQPERAKQGPPIVKESDVVGLEGDVEFLLNKAITSDKRSTICIVGMGGIGKTTLASILYHHPAVAAHFDLRVWITLSTELSDEDDILRELIAVLCKAIGCEGDVIFYSSELHEQVHQLLRHRKYFIIVDEVWEATYFDYFWYAFPQDSSSALVFTSRKWDAIPFSFFHELKLLDAKKSWEMFSKKAFAGDGKCPKHLEEIGKQIVKKCDGLPLAIEEAAELLQQEKAEPQAWEKFLESMDLKKTSASLELSYIYLDPGQKPHFLSLAFFREGTTVRAEKLVQVWVAGELAPFPYGENEMYESTGKWPLDILIGQSLIQVKDKTFDYRIKNCAINNNLRKLAISKATEEIKLEVLAKGRSCDRSLGKRHHLVIHCSREKFKYSLEHDKKLVSLFFHGGGGVDASPSHLKNLNVLKILDWEGFGLKVLPMGVETIVSLKYLGLRNNYVREIPCSLGQLKKLEVLDIAQNFLVEVPDIILEMDSLRHIHMSDIICLNPLKIHSLKNLQTLTCISLDNWAYKLSGLKMMRSLRKLGIEDIDGNTNVRKLSASMVKLRRLQHLILKGFRFRRMPEIEEVRVEEVLQHLKLDGLLTRLPRCIFSGVSCLSLVNSCLDDDPMPTLKNISGLKHLKLQNAYSGKQMVISCNGFKKLESLTIKEFWHLRSVQVEEGSVKHLGKLEIISCPYVDALPEEIGSLRFFMELTMVTTRRIATMIHKLSFISKIQKVDIHP